MQLLDRLLFPTSLAIVGATPRRPQIIANATLGGARVWGVNPTRDEVLGLECSPTIATLPMVPDTAVLVVHHDRILQAFEEALAFGVRRFVAPGLGTEAGKEGSIISSQLAHRAVSEDVALVGPNCMGVAVPGGPSSWLAEIPSTFARGGVAVAVQSGSIGEALLALGPRIGFRCVVSTGAEAKTGLGEFVDFFASDAHTRVVALFVESIREPQLFAAALERCANAGKPVVCLKVGRSQAAARTALAHTGAIVGSDRAFSALLRHHGAIQVHDFPDFVETVEFLGRGSRPAGPRVVVVSESGGEGALFADHAERAALEMPPLSDPTAARLRQEFPNLVTPGNPLDAWAVEDPVRVYPRCIELLADSGDYDVIVAQLDLSRHRSEADQVWNRAVVEAMARLVGRNRLTPAIATVHTSDPPEWAEELAEDRSLPLLRGTGCATRAIRNALRWSPSRKPEFPVAKVELDGLLRGGGTLPEHESARVLERYGVRFAPYRVARTPAEAASAAMELGLPVVVKVVDAAHKTRVGGVILGVCSPEAAETAAEELGGRVLVAKQLPAGVEAYCGMTRDPQFGAIVAVGLGGTAVERLAPPAVALAPVDIALARELVAEAGFQQATDELAETVVALGRLGIDHEDILEVDINPLILGEHGAVAVDALVVIDQGERT